MSTRGKLERGESEKKERRPEQILYRITDFENHETIGTGAFSRVRLVRNILEDQNAARDVDGGGGGARREDVVEDRLVREARERRVRRVGREVPTRP